ncbi:hypothetical protein CVIRNUC_010395 [Coccomyxa viridis]|uniref:Uncharacterized protein n=1 Tax=Coccomyxa viridis TaxID=1274662 RepID=A0AAV1IJ69_9CHLO|nr:hypothetical protein CVIRNUC_010395 [Coccomyxa viridis]
MPSPQEVLDNSVSQPATKTWEDVPEETKRKVQTPGFLKRFWRAYVTALDKHPIAVKSATSFFGFMIGDLLAQTITGHGAYDLFRTLRLVAFGVTLDGPVGHVWYTLLDRKVFPNEPTSNRAVVCKMLADQLLWAPFFSCVFFVFTNVLAGHPEMVLPSIQAKLLPMMIANFAVWPIAHLINFKFIPSQQRILYINCCQILWSAYLSNLSAGRTKTR